MNSLSNSNPPADEATPWLTILACQHAVVQFMGFFDMRAWANMEQCVTPDIEWQRPDVTIRGLPHLRETLNATPTHSRVRHIISNFQHTFHNPNDVLIKSYFTVYRMTGDEVNTNATSPLVGPVSVGRYIDHLVLHDGRWKIKRKETFVDFRRQPN
jgi:hypothetical protein